MKLRSTVFLFSLLAAASMVACEKSSSSGGASASGGLSAAEKDLLAHLPKGGIAVLGGNSFELQSWMETSPLVKMTAEMSSPEVVAWNACLGKAKMTMAGTMAMENAAPIIRIFIKGVSLSMFEKCAQSAGLEGSGDPDGKFLTVELKQPGGATFQAPYLALDGGVYSQVQLAGLGAMMEGKASMIAATRADLEKDVASLAQGNAATDERFTATLAKVDRSKTVWFVGSAEGTPLADKLGLVYGGISIGNGLGLNVTAQLKEAGDVDEILAKFEEGKAGLDKAPPQMKGLKEAIQQISLSKADGGLRASISLSNAQLEEIIKGLAPMMKGQMP